MGSWAYVLQPVPTWHEMIQKMANTSESSSRGKMYRFQPRGLPSGERVSGGRDQPASGADDTSKETDNGRARLTAAAAALLGWTSERRTTWSDVAQKSGQTAPIARRGPPPQSVECPVCSVDAPRIPEEQVNLPMATPGSQMCTMCRAEVPADKIATLMLRPICFDCAASVYEDDECDESDRNRR